MLFAYIASCTHGWFDPVLLGISSGCFWVYSSHSLSDSQCRAITPGMYAYIYFKCWCVQVNSIIFLLFLYLCHTCSCMQLQQRNRVVQRPIAIQIALSVLAFIWTETLDLISFSQGCCNYFHFWTFLLYFNIVGCVVS